ncbi:hypothetical protein FNV43_RR01240 [Rhamnella rubrinervis]|uniref:LRAT domain-containing protein n=1 Tax=Rhamnella rubrinervis TaxID=2594499 RepID=A0A8K0HP95_9ROSA|nr:hypothetical protein FNV43_RR01240 [Rhamnella rubrinervis]
MPSKIGRDELRPGDHIYTWRSGYSYSHHGIYVGAEKVIHLTRGPGLILFSNSAQSSDDHVEYCDIEDFLCDGQLYRFEYGVSRSEFLMKRPGTCSFASSDPPEKVLHRASYLLEHGFGNYHLLNRNCEDFAIYCKTGFIHPEKQTSFSGQIHSLYAAGFALTIIPYRFLPAGLIGIALVVCGLYCVFRVLGDAGSRRRDLGGVEVEKLADLSNTHNIRENSTTTRFRRHVLSFAVSKNLKLRGFKLEKYRIYMGDGKVSDLTRGPDLISSSRVVCCDMENFLCDGELYRFEYGVSRFEFLMKRRGTCSLASSNPPEQVLHRASYLLEHGFDYVVMLDGEVTLMSSKLRNLLI